MSFKSLFSHHKADGFVAAVIAMLFCGFGAQLHGADATATLSETQTEVGQPVQYQISVPGATGADVPQQLRVDGLDISYNGSQVQNSFNLTNRGLTQNQQVNYVYTVVPQRAGRFTIPAQTLNVNGKKLTTNAVVLNVGGGGTAGNNAAAGGSDSRLSFAEIVMPKQTAFFGETVPVELRFYVDTRVHWQTEQPPAVTGEGFTIQKFAPNPQQTQVNRDGRVFDLVTFKTAVTPAKTGKLTLGPATLEAVAQLPRPRRQRQRGLFDDPFDDFFNDPFGAMSVPQRLTIKSEPAEIDVKPLPTAGQPKSFSGAVGQFQLSTSASPSKVRVGDPITITTKLTGRGNFDRVGAPQVDDESGWRSYPPSAKFRADDDVGISGAKTFEIAVIPNEKKDKLPAIRWSYFDPVKEKYVTLTGQQSPITVEGASQPPPATVTAPGSNSSATSSPAPAVATHSPQPTPSPSDILYIRTDPGRWGFSFEPIYRSRNFWLAQLAPMAALLAFAGLRVRQSRRRDLRAQRALASRREKGEALRTLRRSGVSDAEFYDAAVRCIQLDTAAATGQEPAAVDAAEACATRQLDDATVARVQAIFAARAELRYAGVSRGGQGESPSDRRAEVIDTIKRFEEAAPRG